MNKVNTDNMYEFQLIYDGLVSHKFYFHDYLSGLLHVDGRIFDYVIVKDGDNEKKLNSYDIVMEIDRLFFEDAMRNNM